MPQNDPTEEMVRREIAEARRILREDGLLLTQKEILARFDKHFPDETPEDESGDPKPPKRKESPETAQPEEKSGIWWGNKLHE